jgi:hypothetical protein
MADLSDAAWWKAAIVAVLTEPLLGPLLVLIAGAAWTGAWKLKGSIDGGQLGALRERLELAKDREQNASAKTAALEKQIAELNQKVAAGASKEEVLAFIKKEVSGALSEAKTANNAVHHVLTAETGRYEYMGSPRVLLDTAQKIQEEHHRRKIAPLTPPSEGV